MTESLSPTPQRVALLRALHENLYLRSHWKDGDTSVPSFLAGMAMHRLLDAGVRCILEDVKAEAKAILIEMDEREKLS